MDTWDEIAETWDDMSEVQDYAALAFTSLERDLLPFLSKSLDECRVLDFGCGTGLLTEQFAPLCLAVIAIDSAPRMIDVLKAKIQKQGLMNVKPMVGTLGSAAIQGALEVEEGFDLIVASSVCSFLPDFKEALHELTATLEPGGVFVQWDWLSEMPQDLISATYQEVGLTPLSIDLAFEMIGEDGPQFVVMGIGQKMS